ncbi:helicase associated domain-containing protein [Stenotrophomonas sp. NPDC087984]
MVADWVSFNVIDTERQDWARDWAKLKAFTEREGHARVPYEHKEGAFPLGTWVAEHGKLTADKLQALAALGLEWAA